MLGLVLLLPLFIVLWISAKLSNRRSGLVTEERVGKNGKSVKLLRFQIPCTDMDDLSTTAEVKPVKKRLNRLTRILCFFKIDSWPLFFNILKSDLSFVGPRPEKPEFVAQYTDEQRQVLAVRPGIWGPNGYLNDIEEDNFPRDDSSNWKEDYRKYVLPAKLRAELEYIQSHYPGKDLQVFLQALKMNLHRAVNDQLMGASKSYNFVLPLDLILLCLSYFLAYQPAL